MRSLRFAFFVVLVTAAALSGQPGHDLRVGIVGTDTSHVIQFTRILNNASDPEHVPGARVVAAYKSGSTDIESSRSRVDGYAQQLAATWGVEMVPDIATLCSKVDVVVLESGDGRTHLEQVKPIFAAHKPVFIDKPLAATLEDARETSLRRDRNPLEVC
jgi:predicted dehydrogenase